MKYFRVLLLGCLFIICPGEKVRYDNYRVYTVKVKNDAELEAFQELGEFSDGINFLTEPNLHQSFQILVPPHKIADISEVFSRLEIENEIRHENFQLILDAEKVHNGTTYAAFGWNQYYNLDGINAWLDEMVKKHPSLTSQNYGKSVEGRPLRAVKLSKKAGNPTIFIESTIHAREWVTAATTTYIINELLTSSDPEMQNLANSYDWLIVPVANVDGYAYTHGKDRMWRKNRKPNGQCTGTDLNRNFDHHHAAQGASGNPCSETYAGPSPFSEPESSAISKLVAANRNIKMYISFHAYSQLILFPYGHTKQHAPNHDQLNKVAEVGKAAIAKRFNTQYRVGPIAAAIYIASGSSIDWAYEKQGIKLSYCFEFRDTGRHGFILPADQIIPNSQEVIDALKAMLKQSRALNYF